MPTSKEKGKSANRHMDILMELLQISENKSCTDCETRGPRWASWNLGIFLCIRCAGIHRNLGVHISRVKSVNLDSWTPQQVARMQDIGNGLAKRVYETHLPENFRRPQTDSALEQFIRSKYQDKRYIDRDWKPPNLRDQPTYGQTSAIQNSSTPPSNRGTDKKIVLKNSNLLQTNNALPHTQSSPSFDLLNLDSEGNHSSGAADKPSNLAVPRNNLASKSPSADDLFGDFVSSTVVESQNKSTPSGDKQENSKTQPTQFSDLSGLDFSSGPGFGNFGGGNQSAPHSNSNPESSTDTKPKSTKESILALYANSSIQQSQSFNPPAQQNQTMAFPQFGQFAANNSQDVAPPDYFHHQLLTTSSSSAQPIQSSRAGGATGSNSQLLLGELGGGGGGGGVNPAGGGGGQTGLFGLQHNPFFAANNADPNPSAFNQQTMPNMFSGLQLNPAPPVSQFNPAAPSHQTSENWANLSTGQTFATNLWQ